MRAASYALSVFIGALLVLPVAAQGQALCASGNGALDTAQGKDPPADAVEKFAANEAKLRQTVEAYTFSVDMTVQTWSEVSMTGDYRRVTDVNYENHKPKERITFTTVSTLRGIAVEQNDLDDARNGGLGLIVPETLGEYFIRYTGQQPVDQLQTLVFEVAPKKEGRKGLFQGTVWVDSADLVIVKTCGQIMRAPVTYRIAGRRVQDANLSPLTVTYREQVDNKFWFPTYARADDDLVFRNHTVHIREIIKHLNYKPARAPGPP